MIDAGLFADFMEAVHGHRPFAWQTRLFDEVRTQGWPDLIDVPTGCGKTATLDIALLALAADPATSPRRICFVVDRRVIVQQVAERASRLLSALSQPSAASPIMAVREKLLLLGGRVDAPFMLAELRGGVARDQSWAQRPDIPTVLVSTVDQVGSRLLFRGYGVSARSRPIHAGLLGADALYLLDEVHLSRPFAETLRRLKDLPTTSGDLPRRFQVCELSATPGLDGGRRFRLLDEDDRDRALQERRRARKVARLVGPVGTAAADPAMTISKEVVRLLRDRDPAVAKVVGVVVNRVRTAREVARAVAAETSLGHQTVLLTGRMRAIDRDDLMTDFGHRIMAGRSREEDDSPPLVVVATQCIEAGADLDFDMLITEAAPIDALRQRFGRVDRLGSMSAAGTPAEVHIIGPASVVNPKKPDPVYADSTAATWNALTQAFGDLPFDVGPSADGLEALTDAALRAPTHEAPLLTSGTLDLLATTNPPPWTDPRVDDWLHGMLRDVDNDLQIVWRHELPDHFSPGPITTSDQDGALPSWLRAALTAAPPLSSVAVTLPISVARRWLLQQGVQDSAADDVADVDGQEPSVAKEPATSRTQVIVWRGPEESALVDVTKLRPGDTVVVSTLFGGLTGHDETVHGRNWAPDITAAVADDHVERSLWERGGRGAVRLHPDWLASLLDEPRPAIPPLVHDSRDEEAAPPAEAVQQWLTSLLEGHPEGMLATLLHRLKPSRRNLVPVQVPSSEESKTPCYFVLYQAPKGSAAVLEGGTDDDLSASFIGATEVVTLGSHMLGVGGLAAEYGAALGFPDTLVGDLRLAGELHDLGKADDRFQRWLHGGDEVAAAMADDLLAKSTLSGQSWPQVKAAQVRAAYPEGARHEFLSSALIQSHHEVLAQAHDPDLVLHLVESHHGFARPHAPSIADPSPRDVKVTWDGHDLTATSDHGLDRLNSEVTARFDRCQTRYGWHGLAWLEAILRLADQNRSAQEQERRA